MQTNENRLLVGGAGGKIRAGPTDPVRASPAWLRPTIHEGWDEGMADQAP